MLQKKPEILPWPNLGIFGSQVSSQFSLLVEYSFFRRLSNIRSSQPHLQVGTPWGKLCGTQSCSMRRSLNPSVILGVGRIFSLLAGSVKANGKPRPEIIFWAANPGSNPLFSTCSTQTKDAASHLSFAIHHSLFFSIPCQNTSPHLSSLSLSLESNLLKLVLIFAVIKAIVLKLPARTTPTEPNGSFAALSRAS